MSIVLATAATGRLFCQSLNEARRYRSKSGLLPNHKSLDRRFTTAKYYLLKLLSYWIRWFV